MCTMFGKYYIFLRHKRRPIQELSNTRSTFPLSIRHSLKNQWHSSIPNCMYIKQLLRKLSMITWIITTEFWVICQNQRLRQIAKTQGLSAAFAKAVLLTSHQKKFSFTFCPWRAFKTHVWKIVELFSYSLFLHPHKSKWFWPDH